MIISNLLRISISGIALTLAMGCTATLPTKGNVDPSYSLVGVKTVSIQTHCDEALIVDLDSAFQDGYCEALAANIKIAIKRKLRVATTEIEPDLVVNTKLEEVRGGSAAARFLIGFGAGRSVTTVYVKILRNQQIIAEGRITETTTMPDMVGGSLSNEDVILVDAPRVANKIADFVVNPKNEEQSVEP